MLATADCTNHYSEQIIYESEWTEEPPTGISWLNVLTAQPIPEETDGMDSPRIPVRNNRESNCSSSSVESCYVVLEIQRPRSIDETSSKVDDEEEEEMEEEIEELNFAQMKHDDHNINYEQFAVSMTTEAPMEEYAVTYQQEQFIPAEEYARVTQPVILETPNDILFHKAKALSRFTKRMKAMSYLSTKEQQFSTSSDDESLKITKLKTIRKINEYHPTAISTVAAEQKSTIQQSNSSRYSTTSIDSIENKSLNSSPNRTRITTTFSNLSSQRPLNPIQIQRPSPTMGTTTLTRTFAFDRACMEKYGRVQEQKNDPIQIQIKPVCETIINEEIELPLKTNEQIEPPSSPEDSLNCRSFINTISTPFYIGSEPSTIDDSELEHHSSIPPSPSVSNNPSKASSIIYSMKKYARTVTSEYRLTHNNNENSFTEPTLLQVRYLDGRLPLQDDHARESFRQSQTLSGSISNRLNRLGLTKISSTQDLSLQTTTFNIPYRKRMLNRFRTFIENNSPELSPIPQSRPWQHKTISELFNERKFKVNRQL